MKIRDLKQRVGDSVVSSWPPVWAASLRAGDKLPVGETGVLESAVRAQDHVKLIMRFDGREHHGRLKWDPPPSVEAVAKILSANVGQKLRAIGALDIDSEQSRA